MAENRSALTSDIDRPFTFRRRPIPVPAESRAVWKVAELLLILRLSSRGGRSSLKRLHLLNWAVRSASNRAAFADSRRGTLPLFRFIVRFEPAFSRAIDLAAGLGYVDWNGGDRIQLSAKGNELADQFLKDTSLLQNERTFFGEIGKSVTESEADYVLGV